MNFEKIDITEVLHDTRTAYLRDLEVDGKTMVSVGANGQWYFEWIHANCGYPKRHIGVELYLPKPDFLPDNSEWIANTAGDMSDVESSVADIVFSGQNIEHLWEFDVTNFIMETNRILKTGGLLVVDSPNRDITAALCIIQPEHMVELTPSEMVDILDAAGFDVVKKRGIFLLRDPRNGEILPYQPDSLWTGRWSLIQRCAMSDRHVDDSYLWWIEARKSERAPDREKVRQLVRAYWQKGWPERMNRLQSEFGAATPHDGKSYYTSVKGVPGALIYGPYVPIVAGRYRASMMVALVDEVDPDQVVGIMDVLLNYTLLAQIDIFGRDLLRDRYQEISIEFETNLDTSFGLQCRIVCNGTAGLSAERDLKVETL